MPPADTQSVLSQTTVSSAGGARSIYPRGPTFSLDTFATKDFVVNDFVESLSDGATPMAARRSGVPPTQAFDPKPHIRAFEYALSRLNQLSDQRESHELELSNAVQRAGDQHRQQCVALQSRLDQALEAFNQLENGVETSTADQSVGGQTDGGGILALRVGEKLGELDTQKKRAEDAKFLVQCWQDVSERGDLSHLEDVRRLGGGEGKVKCAHVARQLLEISARLIPQKQSNGVNGHAEAANNDSVSNGERHSFTERRQRDTKEVVEKFLERLEKDLLEQFDESKRQLNEVSMRDCATALYDFGSGSSVIARFVNQHELFLERSHFNADELNNDPEAWEQLANPDADSLGVELSLQSLVDEIKLVLQEESITIKRVFPFHEQVLITFLQRVFQQLIQQRLEMVLEKASSVSPLALLRTLHAARTYVGNMVEELKVHGLTEHPDEVSTQVSATLDQQFEDLFIPYIAGTAYVDQERRSLEDLYGSLLFRFTLYHSRRKKIPTTYLGSLSQRGRELLASARDSYVETLESTELSALQKTILTNISGIGDADSRNKAEIEVSEADGALSLAAAKRMLKWLAEAVGRGLELSGGSETPKEVAAHFKLLLQNLGEIYIETALDAALETATVQENAKTEPELAFTTDLHRAVNILQLMLTIVNSVMLPLTASNVTIHRDTKRTSSIFVARLEDKISGIRSHVIEVALNWVAKLLLRQNRADFRPRDDAIGLEQLQTSTCAAIFEFLTKFRNLSASVADGKNLEPFFTDLAAGLRSLLFDHFKKFQVNLAGGLMVSKDITKYIELLKTFRLAPSFAMSLEILTEIGNIFVIGPEALKDRLRGGSALAGIDKADLRPYIMRRDDANSVGVQTILNAL